MNLKEKTLCVLDTSSCVVMAASATFAMKWAEELAFPDRPVNNIFDAMRHAYWSAQMAARLGVTEAKVWGDAHEWGAADAESTCMDLYNNAVGRDIGREAGFGTSNAILKQRVQNAAHRGDLQAKKGC